MATSPEVIRQRRIVAVIAFAVLAALLVVRGHAAHRLQGRRTPETAAAGQGDADGDSRSRSSSRAAVARSSRDYRVVAYYGAPQDKQLGALGIGSPTAMTKKLVKQSKGYERKSRPVMPAMELIAVVAAARPRRGRPLQPAPARFGHPPLPEGRPQGQGAADPRHPARPQRLLHRDQAPAQVPQGARRRARARPRMADGPEPDPRQGHRPRRRATRSTPRPTG